MKKQPVIFSGYDWQYKKINEYKKISTEGVGIELYIYFSILKFQYYARATYCVLSCHRPYFFLEE